jgi:flagellar hook-associated protein 2
MATSSTSFAGMGSGLDINSLVTKLMTIERQPLTKLQNRQAVLKRQITAIDAIKTRLDDVSNAALALSSPSKWGTTKATSSDTSVATVSSSGQGSSGTVAFNVTKLASAHGLRSVNTLAATSAQVAAANSTLLVGRGVDALGIASLSNASGVTAGKLDVSVSKSTQAATRSGSPLPATVTIASGNNTMSIAANGVAHSITLANGTYDKNALVTALNSAFTAAGASVRASAADNGVAVSTLLEGSAASLQVTGGSALADLGFTVDAVATTGVDGIVSIGGVQTTVSAAQAGTNVNVASANGGSLTLGLSGGLRAGTGVAAVVNTGDGSLSAVVEALNAIKTQTGVTAAAVRVGSTAFRMQISSSTSGAASKLSVSAADLSALGGVVESSAASDAEVTIGTGAGAYTATSSSNTFSDLIAGSNITVLKNGAATVNSEINNNVDAVAALVEKANGLLTFIADQARASSSAPGLLSGDASIRRFTDVVRRAVLNTNGGVAAGISINRSGSFTFSKEEYQAAYATDPDGVRNRFAQSIGSFAHGSLAQASDRTQAGTYAVSISQAATRAFATLSSWSAPMAFSRGGVSATFTPSASASASDTASALNSFFTTNGFGLAAAVDGANVSITASAWGTDGNFSINSTNYTGNNVQGTIDGQAATGSGRSLFLAGPNTSPAQGLRLTITATTTGSLGNVEFRQGMAAALRNLAVTATENSSPLRAAKAAREARVKSGEAQVVAMERRLKNTETQIRRQYSTLDSNLGQLQNTSSWLAQQTARAMS